MNIRHHHWAIMSVTVGYGYSTLAWIPFAQGSWALPLLHERITSWDSPISQAVQQLSSVSSHLPSRALSLWDSEYGCAPFVNQTAELPVDKLMRLRSNLCLWGVPDTYEGRGRPKVHGDKFKFNDPMTWSSPVQQVEMDDPKLGKVRVPVWHNLHFRLSPAHPMSILLVERLTLDGCARVSKPMWRRICGIIHADYRRSLAAIFAKVCDRPLVSFCQKSTTLDSSCIKYTRSMRSMERFNADCHARNYGWLVTLSHSVLFLGRNLRSSSLLDGWLNLLGAF